MRSSVPTQRGVVIALAGAAAMALLGAIFTGLFGDLLFRPASIGADAFSSSALGHSGLLAWLEERGNPPLIVRSLGNRNDVGDAPLLVLEPAAYDAAGRLGTTWLATRTAPTLLVLPKRTGVRDDDQPLWIESSTDVRTEDIEGMLERARVPAIVHRERNALSFEYGRLGGRVVVDAPQLLESKSLEPLVGGPTGTLLGRVRGRNSFFVLSDPDVLANHGIDDPANRAFLEYVFAPFLAPGTPVAVDETVHGATFERDIWREALRLPLLPLTLSILLTAALTLLAARRFLDPRREAPPWAAGKRVLIDNTAGLNLDGDRFALVCAQYRSLIETTVAQALRIPDPRSHDARRLEIQRRAALLGKPFDLQRWQESIDALKNTRRGANQALAALIELKDWADEVIGGKSSS